jgi:hypothetical protein
MQNIFTTDGIVDPAQSAQASAPVASGMGWLDQLGGTFNSLAGSFGSGLIDQYFGKQPKSNLTGGEIAVDQTAVLGDAKINQNTTPQSFIKANWMYIAGGAVAIGALVLIAKK